MHGYRHTVAIAPMMEWTDRHCRFFHRRLTRRALLHTEMITADAVIHGDRRRLLGFHRDEQPVAVQLAGSEPAKIADAARIAAEFGYDEINLNVGCPSHRVQSGRFGACLMREPRLVGELVAAAKAAVVIPVTVKCRLGVDDQDPDAALGALAEAAIAAGCDALWVHARKAWLSGLSPKENREVPPLEYRRVVALKARFPETFIGINGGIAGLEQAAVLLGEVDGVMLGRCAYHSPAILAEIDHRFYGDRQRGPGAAEAVRAMLDYIAAEVAGGTRLSSITRHMLGLFQGVPGARRWRQILTVDALRRGAGVETIRAALAEVTQPRGPSTPRPTSPELALASAAAAA
jgi:tRNA-dihydrouridine synthase A